MAQDSKTEWIAIAFEPFQKWCAALDYLSVLITSTIDMVYGKKFGTCLTATGASTAVMVDNVGSQLLGVDTLAFALLILLYRCSPGKALPAVGQLLFRPVWFRAIHAIEMLCLALRVRFLTRAMRDWKWLAAKLTIPWSCTHAFAHGSSISRRSQCVKLSIPNTGTELLNCQDLGKEDGAFLTRLKPSVPCAEFYGCLYFGFTIAKLGIDNRVVLC